MVLEAITRGDIANYVSALFTVYVLLMLVYVLVNLLLSFGLTPPYARWFDLTMDFLRDICEPYLRIFRKFIPPLGGIDFSPMIGVIVLGIVQKIVVPLIAGT